MKIYLASPFFDEDQIDHVKRMEALLEYRGYDVFSPMRDGVVLKPDATVEERLDTYYDNLRAMDEADVMVAIINDRDTGTTFEQGYFAGRWGAQKSEARRVKSNFSRLESPILTQDTPRVITLSTNGKPVNVMLLGGILRHCNSWEELNEYLEYIDKEGIDYAIRDPESVGSVEVY